MYYGIIYKMMQCHVQSEMVQTIEKKETKLSTIRLTIETFNKSKINAKEIFYQGKLYDIKSVKIENNIAELLVFNDTKEEIILEHIKSLSANTDSNQQKNYPAQLVQLLTVAFVCPTNDISFTLPESADITFFSYSEPLVSISDKIIFPPPKLV